jgi:hypothetical protein
MVISLRYLKASRFRLMELDALVSESQGSGTSARTQGPTRQGSPRRIPIPEDPKAAKSHRLEAALEFCGNCGWFQARIECEGLAEDDRDHAGWSEILLAAFEFV